MKTLLLDRDYTIFKLNKKTVQYLDNDNTLQSETIPEFSTTICNYIFQKLKPIIEGDMDNCLGSDNEYIYNNRVQNLMLFKEPKVYEPFIKQIISNNV